jgi:7-cyano-7-deazaguanine synthase in queuosine biosynthesis
MNPSKKCGPRYANISGINEFCCMVKQVWFVWSWFQWPAYTWTNKRTNANRTYERLDRCLANAAWCHLLPRTSIYHLPILYSDHAPILTVLQGSIQKIKKPIRFEYWWILEDDFQAIASTTWRATQNSIRHNWTTTLAKKLKIWSRKKKPIHEQLPNNEQQLAQLRSLHPWHRNHTQEQKLTNQHHHLLQKQAEYHKKRYKKQWVPKADRNTNFFHKAILKRTRKNRIHFMMDQHGNQMATPQDTAQVVINYFNNLFTSQLPDNGSSHNSIPHVNNSNIFIQHHLKCRTT